MNNMTRFSPGSEIGVIDREGLGLDIVNPNTGEKYCYFNAVGEVALFLYLSEKMKRAEGWAKTRALEGVSEWTEEEAPESQKWTEEKPV
jgi:hypothetical protein